MRENLDVMSTEPAETDLTAPALVDAARAFLVAEVGVDVVGAHEDALSEGPGVVTQLFATNQPGYPGWQWAVTVSYAAGEAPAAVTLDDVVLLPGAEAIVAPAWVPWRERIQPGDLSPGDLLPADEDDPRLVPGWLAGDSEDPDDRAAADEVGLGRPRVLSLEGRYDAAERWYTGEQGPDVPLSQSAPDRCRTCGFLVRLAGPLSLGFGVCANEFANDDGRVVALEHGCGAHSGAQLKRKQLPPPLPDHVFDTISRDDLVEF